MTLLSPIKARIKTIFSCCLETSMKIFSLDETISSGIELIWNIFLADLEKIEMLRVKRFASVQPEEIDSLLTWFL